MSLKTVVLGASVKPDRYAYKAIESLVERGHEVVPLGLKEGEVAGIPFLTGTPEIPNVDTVTLYVGPAAQSKLIAYILSLNPRRIIFNPGTENVELEQAAHEKGIKTIQACTLVLLSTGQY